MSTKGSGASSQGKTTPVNEDAYLVRDGLGLYVVCDGASDGPAGEVAAAIAVDALERYVTSIDEGTVGRLHNALRSQSVATEAIRAAMDAVVGAASERDELDGMASTVSMFLTFGDRATVCHVGDSRVYLLRSGQLHLLTSDHGLTVEDAYAEATLECFSVGLLSGDTFLLCTDGAADAVEDPSVFAHIGEMSPWAAANWVVQTAHERLPDCDATAVAVRVVRTGPEPGWLWLSAQPRPFAYGHTVGPN